MKSNLKLKNLKSSHTWSAKCDCVHFPSMSGEERRGRRASKRREAGKKFSWLVAPEQERERAQWPDIVSQKTTALDSWMRIKVFLKQKEEVFMGGGC